MGVRPCVGKIPWRRKWQPTPVFLPWEISWVEEPGGITNSWTQLSARTHTRAFTNVTSFISPNNPALFTEGYDPPGSPERLSDSTGLHSRQSPRGNPGCLPNCLADITELCLGKVQEGTRLKGTHSAGLAPCLLTLRPLVPVFTIEPSFPWAPDAQNRTVNLHNPTTATGPTPPL